MFRKECHKLDVIRSMASCIVLVLLARLSPTVSRTVYYCSRAHLFAAFTVAAALPLFLTDVIDACALFIDRRNNHQVHRKKWQAKILKAISV